MTTYGSNTALVVVDVQNDFADPSGSLFVEGGPRVVEAVNAEVAAAQEAGAFVVYTQDWHPPVTPHFADHGGVWPVHCVRETWGAQLHDDLLVAGPTVRKGVGGEDGYSGFSMRDPETGEEMQTYLHRLLADQDITEVVVVGLAEDVCVKATALDALRLGYTTTVPRAATAAVNIEPGEGDRAAAELASAGVTVIG